MKAIDAVLADARPKLSPRCGYCLVSSLLVRQEQGTGRVRFRANDRLHQVARSTVPSVARVATRTHALRSARNRRFRSSAAAITETSTPTGNISVNVIGRRYSGFA